MVESWDFRFQTKEGTSSNPINGDASVMMAKTILRSQSGLPPSQEQHETP
jgi:hypothetical protein